MKKIEKGTSHAQNAARPESCHDRRTLVAIGKANQCLADMGCGKLNAIIVTPDLAEWCDSKAWLQCARLVDHEGRTTMKVSAPRGDDAVWGLYHLVEAQMRRLLLGDVDSDSIEYVRRYSARR